MRAQWKNGVVIDHPKKAFWNSYLSAKKGDIDRAIIELSYNGAFVNKTAKESLQILKEYLDPELAAKKAEENRRIAMEKNSFMRFFSARLETIENDGTRTLYRDTYNKVIRYCRAHDIDPQILSFSDIDKKWLESFEHECLITQRQNTASRHLRDIRAVFNSAIDEGITTCYPFRKFVIKKEETLDKSYTAKELRTFFNYECYEGGQRESVDMFKLMFCLIGINCVDLAYAAEADRGRLNYVRMKTHKPYSVKIELEAQKLINKYRGVNGRLVNILDRSSNYKTYFNRMSKNLRKVGLIRVSGKKSNGKAILPGICIGSARTSWATIAQEELDIPREVIAAALGHHTVDVTSTYLRTDWRRKVDEANRMVLDWVFYEKRPMQQVKKV
jgi:integrase